ncbi:MAG: isopentenyl-diphosphate Delta-isomerase [Pyrinomonadaceae bacterium]|nr:isopentenyl-diphosphate Delta-isomerase [Pyrinomonadaceae bacterium]
MRRFYKQGIYAAAVTAFLAVGAFFMANVEMPPWAGYVSAVNVVLFAVPVIWALRRWLGWRDGMLLFAILGVYALAIETTAIITGFPYGHFGYSDYLGYRILGYAPWTVAFAWTPLMLGAFAFASLVAANRVVRIVLTTIILTGFDFVLDPGAVYLGFWQYADGGWYYGVPWSNFAGWLVSGFIGSVITEAFVAYAKPLLPVPVQMMVSVVFIVIFWTLFAAFAGMILPALIGVSLTAAVFSAYVRKYYAFDEMLVFVDEENRPLRTERKALVHTDATELHRAFSVFIFNSRGELLLQQRALSKQTWPGVWSNSCCGHVMLHETVEDAAVRRTRFELGIGGIKVENMLPEFRYRAEKEGIVENEICPVLTAFDDREPKPNADEVESTRWMPWEEFLRMARDPQTELSPWCIMEAERLAASERFRKWFGRPVDTKQSEIS